MAKVQFFEAEGITKYNHNHDPATGRFSSGSGGGSGSKGSGGTTIKPRDGKKFFDANDLGGLPAGARVKAKSGKVLQRSDNYEWFDTDNPDDKYSLMDLQWNGNVNGIAEISIPKDGLSIRNSGRDKFEITDKNGNLYIVNGSDSGRK